MPVIPGSAHAWAPSRNVQWPKDWRAAVESLEERTQREHSDSVPYRDSKRGQSFSEAVPFMFVKENGEDLIHTRI